MADKLGKAIEQRPLSFENPGPGRSEVKPFRAIDLRECLHLAASRRPFDLDRIAPDGVNIKIAFDGESDYPFSGTLANFTERFERLLRKHDAGLLGKFTLSNGAGILLSVDLSLRDRPRALVLASPVRSRPDARGELPAPSRCNGTSGCPRSGVIDVAPSTIVAPASSTHEPSDMRGQARTKTRVSLRSGGRRLLIRGV
jgi:hypothetical protein